MNDRMNETIMNTWKDKNKELYKETKTHKAINEWKDKRAKKASKQAVKQWR